jgi:hypothetical protein
MQDERMKNSDNEIKCTSRTSCKEGEYAGTWTGGTVEWTMREVTYQASTPIGVKGSEPVDVEVRGDEVFITQR